MGAILEHMALRVKDLDWYIRFFEEVFDMPIGLRTILSLVANAIEIVIGSINDH